MRVTPNGVERSPGIFISRLVPGGLAESTGLLGVNDEVLEVNGIDVSNKTLDQVSGISLSLSIRRVCVWMVCVFFHTFLSATYVTPLP